MTGNITAVQTGSGWDVDQTGTANLQGDLQPDGSIILNANGSAAVAAALGNKGAGLDVAPITLRTPPESKTSLGTKWVDLALVTATNSGSIVSSYPASLVKNAAGLAFKAGAGARSDMTLATPVSIAATDTAIGFWAYRKTDASANTAGRPIACKLIMSGDGLTTTLYGYIAIYPGLNYYVMPLFWQPSGTSVNVMSKSGTVNFPYSVNQIIFQQADTYGQLKNSVTNDDLYIGDININPKGRAKIAITFDHSISSSHDANYSAHGTGNPVVDGQGNSRIHSYASFVQSFGWRYMHYVITGAVNQGIGATGQITTDELRFLRDEYGAVICNHGAVHPGTGDPASGALSISGSQLLGPQGYWAQGSHGAAITSWASGAPTSYSYSPANDATNQAASYSTNKITNAYDANFDAACAVILKEWEDASDRLTRWGFDTGAHHMALSQGAIDVYVMRAVDLSGFRTVRTVEIAPTYPAVGLSPTVTPGGQYKPARANLGSFQMDGSNTLAQFQDYVNRLIACGGLGSTYTHSWGAGTGAYRTLTAQMFAWLKTQEQAGLIDVVVGDALLAA